MTTFLYILVFAIGIVLGGFVVYRFNPKDTSYNIENLKAKKGGVIDVSQENLNQNPKRRGIFTKLKNRRRKR